ncbi:Arylsulfatase [Symmachiella dynata]|uniref:sulfatase family protein n=1 Tax=Symmachiella dynata TaxID=2527995 RepID=UPI00118B36E2|nr:sulfatase-like hydrolase/transferase [Symmachiella dynata]QDT49001.1 Arylsulfatase [Symmachiella dynata]
MRRLSFCIALITYLNALAAPQVIRGEEQTELSQTAKPPNLLFILTDQHRQDSVGAYGLSSVKTPHIDRLASDGIRFELAYAAQPVCSPNRASIFSGLYPHGHGVPENNIPLPEKVVTFANRLQSAGYETGYFGKWHLGRRFGTGFEQFPEYPADGRGKDHYFIMADGSRRYAPDVLTDDAIEFLRKKRDRPFFAMLSYYPPHPPYSVPQKYEDLYLKDYPDEPLRRSYYGMCTKVDEQIGRLLDVLDELDVRDNTLIVFTTEHGHFFQGGGGRGDRLDKRSLKRACYDEAARIPLVMCLPGVIPGGQTSRQLICSVDLKPTLLNLLGLEIPEYLHGHDLSEVVRGRVKQLRDYLVFVNVPFVEQPERGLERCVRNDQWKLILSDTVNPELYDMHNDPQEHHNLYEQRRGSPVVRGLVNDLAEWSDEVHDPLTPQLINQLAPSEAEVLKSP